jgi:hypothetical protein
VFRRHHNSSVRQVNFCGTQAAPRFARCHSLISNSWRMKR